MKPHASQQGVSLMEIAFVIVIFSFIIFAGFYGVQVVRSAKVKAFIVQLTFIKNASETFRRQYGTWPGDYGEATNRLRNCNASVQCENGNGDQIISNASNSNACRMPAYTSSDQAFPCTSITGGNETAQFWRHLVLADMIENISLRSGRYRWGDAFPKVRLGGGFQVLYNGDPANDYVKDLTGHFIVYQRSPTQFHRSYAASGDGVMSSADARSVDIEIDDGAPHTGVFRSRGGFACIEGSGTTTRYTNYGQMDCSVFYKYSQ